MQREVSYLKDLLLAARKIEGIVASRNRAEFLRDEIAQAAVLHHLTVIGEAANRLSPELKLRHPGIPWAQIIAARNRIVHEYFGLDWELLWTTAAEEVPALRSQAAILLRIEFGETVS